MFGSKGFSNPLGDDILNSFIQDTAKKSHSHKSSTLTDADEKHLLSTKKLVQQLAEEEENQVKKTPVVKTTSSLAQSNIIKKKPSDTKTYDDVDDLLDFIEGAKSGKPLPNESKKSLDPTPTNNNKMVSKSAQQSIPKQQQQSVSNKFADVLSDEEEEVPAYDPTVRSSVSKRGNSQSEDISKKKNALFGLSNSLMTNMNNKSNSSDTQNTHILPQRPQTMETKAARDEEDFGEINIGFSRIKGKNSAQKKRPSTTEGDSPVPYESRPLNIPRPSTSGHEHKDHDIEEEGDGEYLNTFGNRDRKEKKPAIGSLKTVESQRMSPGKAGGFSYLGETMISPVKSPKSDFAMSKDSFFPNKDGVFMHMPLSEKKEESPIPRNPVGILGKKDLSEPQGLQMPGRNTVNVTNTVVRKEGFGGKIENLQTSGVSQWEPSHRGGSIGHIDGDRDAGAMQGYFKETEEYYKKRTRESEEYYENRYKQLKKAMDEEKGKWEEIHEKELKLVKKENEDLKENMNRHLERERERLKEMFALEMESKEKIHKYELERIRHQTEEETQSLKKQMEAQVKLNALADEIKHSSSKLISLSDKMDNEKGTGIFGRKGESREKERELEDLERRLKHELEMVHNEKKRLDRLRAEQDSRDSEDRVSLEKEKEVIRQEYNRLNEMQDSIRRQEVEKIRNLEKEKALYEMERGKLEKDNIKIRDEYSKKYHELEVQVELYNIKKKEFDSVLDKTEHEFLKKQQEIEGTMKRLSAIEVELMKKVHELEHKELIANKGVEEVQRRLDLLELERLTFEKERGQILHMADQVREDGDQIKKFKLDFEKERQNNVLLRGEVANFSRALHYERNQLDEERALMHDTIEGMRHNYARDIEYVHQRPLLDINRPIIPIIERSLDPVVEKTPYTFVVQPGATWSSSKKAVEGRENAFEGGYKLPGPVIPQDSKYVRLADLKKEAEQTKTVSLIIERPKEISPERKKVNFEDEVKSWGKKTAHSDAASKTSGLETFNLKNYMAQLKEFDKASSINQSYIANEKEELHVKKVNVAGMYLGGRSKSEKLGKF